MKLFRNPRYYLDSLPIEAKQLAINNSFYASPNGMLYKRGERSGRFIVCRFTHHSNGYRLISITGNDGKRRNYYAHHIIANLFLPNPENKPEVGFLTADKDNLSVGNLIWGEHGDGLKRSHGRPKKWRKRRLKRAVRGYALNDPFVPVEFRSAGEAAKYVSGYAARIKGECVKDGGEAYGWWWKWA